MVSKGLDFDKVSVVGILNADSMLNYPDFRAYEHAFMMMANDLFCSFQRSCDIRAEILCSHQFSK